MAGIEQIAEMCHSHSPDFGKLRSCNFQKSGDLYEPKISGNFFNTWVEGDPILPRCRDGGQTTVDWVSASTGFSYHFGSIRHSTPFFASVASYSLRRYGSSIQ